LILWILYSGKELRKEQFTVDNWKVTRLILWILYSGKELRKEQFCGWQLKRNKIAFMKIVLGERIAQRIILRLTIET
jgi:transposase